MTGMQLGLQEVSGGERVIASVCIRVFKPREVLRRKKESSQSPAKKEQTG